MSAVLATYSIKGGVGKTSAAVNLAVLAAQDGLRTLDQLTGVLDGRPQLLAFFSMVDGRRELHREVMAGVRAAHGNAVLGAAIPVSEQVERMGSERDAVVAFAPDSPGAVGYRALWWDLRRRIGRTMRTLPGR